MSSENYRLADDISGFIGVGNFTTDELFLIEVACRKARMELGPHRVDGAEEKTARKRKRLHQKTAAEISAEIAERYGMSTGSTTVNINVPPRTGGKLGPHSINGLDHIPGNSPHVLYAQKYYRTADLRRVLVGQQYVSDLYPSLSGVVCTVLKVNRTRAIIEAEGKQKKYTIPLTGIIRILMTGEFL